MVQGEGARADTPHHMSEPACLQAIPDIYDVGRDFYTFWFCNSFDIPASSSSRVPLDSEERKVWLHLRGVNYSFR